MTTKPSQSATECSHEPPNLKSARDLVIELRFEIDGLKRIIRDQPAIIERQKRALAATTCRDAASTAQLRRTSRESR